ncbi:MAG TPA: tetratricopeptide repeat protein [Blastocatellia bacterium]|nr:tetratricopeptide repeat protein [Blastocatellia bacterium]
MTKNIMVRSAALALVLALATIAGFAAQDDKNTQADKRAQAAKKYLEAKRLEDSGNLSAAVAAYKEAVALDPTSVDLRTTLGALYLKNRNTIDAEAQAREAIKIAPDNAQVRKLLARVYLAQTFVGTNINKDKARAAIAELEQVVKLEPAAKVEVGDREMPAMTVIGELYWTLEEQDKALDAFKKVSEGNATADEAHFQLASLYFQKHKYRDAVQVARKAYEINPKSPQYAGLLAKSLLYIGRTQEALDIYQKAIGVKNTAAKTGKDAKDDKDQDDDADVTTVGGATFSPLTFDYADALVYAGRYDDAIKAIDPVLKLARKESSLYLTAIRIKTDALKRAGKRDEAVQVLEDALKGQDVSDSLPLVYSLAETYEGNLQFDKAVSIYEEALNSIINPDGTVNSNEQSKNAARVILQRIGLAYRLAGKRDKAMETFEKMKKVLGPDSAIADQLIIDTLINEGKYKEAFEAATTAAAHFPDERGLKFQRAQAAGRLGDMQTADATLKGLLKQSPEDIDVYLYWSSVQLEANQLKEAEDSARKAIDLDPKDIGPLITLSSIQERQKKFKESEATLRRALDIDPDNATVLNNLGYFLADRNERLAEAEALIRRAVNIEPTNGSFLDSLGWLLYRQNKLQEAQKYLELAVLYQSRSATIHDHLGDLYKKTGQADKARAKWEDALKLATEPDEIRRIKEKLGKK